MEELVKATVINSTEETDVINHEIPDNQTEEILKENIDLPENNVDNVEDQSTASES
jgi:hypothetical protein